MPGSLCIDVGANIGERTRVFLALGARVVAVEPQPGCIASLRQIGSRDLTIEQVALGRQIGRANLQIATASTISSMAPEWIARVRSSGRFSEYEWPEVVSVEVTTLDALIERYGVPDFCKIDVEGYEREVIAGLSHPIRFMSFEFVPEWAEGALESVSRLQALGMESFNYSPGESMRLVWSDWTSSAQLLAYLDELPRDGSVFGDVYARL